MAATLEHEDALLNLRQSIKASSPPILSTSATPTPADTVTELARATHITFNTSPTSHRTFSLSASTRFAPNDAPVDLRSCYFAWTQKEAAVTAYFGAVSALNEELPSGAGGSVQHLTFAQRVELVAWLSGETEFSENIPAVDAGGASAAARNAAAIAGGKGVPLEGGRGLDARLLEIYEGERNMGDHNTVLRGSKNIDFSPYRKLAQSFLRSRPTTQSNNSLPPPASGPQTALVSSLQKRPPKRLEPIILLSPSASSLLRTSNAKSFLDAGTFHPPHAGDSSSTNMVRIQRLLPSISSHPLTFILVDSTASFKPTYWPRVVGIFTTGQAWQFKSYKYPNPADLFAKYPGIYVGWANEEPPSSVEGLGRGVLCVKVDKWTGSERGRWRDREVVERIWGRVEEGMRAGGWTREGPGAAALGR